MLALVVAVSLGIGFVVAAGVIGRESRRLSLQPRQPVWRLEEAAAFVEGELSFDVAAKIDGETLRQLLRIHLNQLQFKSDTEAVDQIADEPTVDAVVKAHLQYLTVIGALGAASSSE